MNELMAARSGEGGAEDIHRICRVSFAFWHSCSARLARILGGIPELGMGLVFSSALGLAVVAASALAQDEVFVSRSSHLRQDPSRTHPPILTLARGDVLELLGPAATDGYLHVRTDDDHLGWVLSRNVRPAQEPQDAVKRFDNAAETISAAWAKPAPNHSQFTSNGQTCADIGKGGDTETNLRKNRTDMPVAYHDVKLADLIDLNYPIAPLHRHDWSAGQLAEIEPTEGIAVRTVGYLVAIKPQTGGSGEATNCRWKKSTEVDWHMALTSTAGSGEKEALVVETTPRIRRHHPRWTKAALDPWVDADQPVRISGWVMLDPDHRGHLQRYRATLWEIHPITRIEVFEDGQWLDVDRPH
jgi:hypothetical protein